MVSRFEFLPGFFIIGPHRLLGLIILCKLGRTAHMTRAFLFTACTLNGYYIYREFSDDSRRKNLLGYSSVMATS